jgi:hypothetical protein
VEAAIADIDGVLIANHNAPKQSIISARGPAWRRPRRSWPRPDHDVAEIPVAAGLPFEPGQAGAARARRPDRATPVAARRASVYFEHTARRHSAMSPRRRSAWPSTWCGRSSSCRDRGDVPGRAHGLPRGRSRRRSSAELTTKILASGPHQSISIDEGAAWPDCSGAHRAARLRRHRGRPEARSTPAAPVGSAIPNGSSRYWLDRAAPACLDAQRQLCASGTTSPCGRAAVTLEEASAQPPSPPGAPRAPRQRLSPCDRERRHDFPEALIRASGRGSATTRAMPFTRSSKESRMDQRRPAPGGGDPA